MSTPQYCQIKTSMNSNEKSVKYKEMIDCGCDECFDFVIGFIIKLESNRLNYKNFIPGCTEEQVRILKQKKLLRDFDNYKSVPYFGFKVYNKVDIGINLKSNVLDDDDQNIEEGYVSCDNYPKSIKEMHQAESDDSFDIKPNNSDEETQGDRQNEDEEDEQFSQNSSPHLLLSSAMNFHQFRDQEEIIIKIHKYLDLDKIKSTQILDSLHFQEAKNFFDFIFKWLEKLLQQESRNNSQEQFQASQVEVEIHKIQQIYKYFVNQNQLLLSQSQEIKSDTDQLTEIIKHFSKSIQLEKTFFNLPIYSTKPEFFEQAMSPQNQILLLTGDSGCGKTTQTPLMLYQFKNLDLSSSSKFMKRKIICVQQQKFGITHTIKKIKHQSNLDQQIEFFDQQPSLDQWDKEIIFLTVSLFLELLVSQLSNFNRSQDNEKSLIYQASHIIIDDIHERNIETDLCIGMIYKILKQKQSQSQELPMFIFTSSEAHQDLMHQYFKEFQPKQIKIERHQFPVQINYLDQSMISLSLEDRIISILNKIKQNQKTPEGNILIFLSDQVQIRSFINKVKTQLSGYSLIAFHESFSSEEQNKNENNKSKRIFFTTGQAEESFKIEDVSIVIDGGIEKIKQFDPQKNTNVLTTCSISKKQATQRMNRAGRSCPQGECYLMYRKREYQLFENEQVPEIMRGDLNEALLKIIAVEENDFHSFNFLENPPIDFIQSGLNKLIKLNAIKIENNKHCLTAIGKFMIQAQMQPLLAKILLNSQYLGVFEDTLKVVIMQREYLNIFSEISQENIFQQIYQIKEREQRFLSDFVFFLKIFEYLDQKQKIKVPNQNQKNSQCNKTSLKESEILSQYEQDKVKLNNLFKSLDEKTKNEIQNLIIYPKQEATQDKIQKEKYIIESFLREYDQQIGVFIDIDIPVFYNKQLNKMFSLHPTSSFSLYEGKKGFKFQKGDYIFYSTHEKIDSSIYVQGVSQFDQGWLHCTDTIQSLQENLNIKINYSFSADIDFVKHFLWDIQPQIEKKLEEFQKKNKEAMWFQGEKSGKVSYYYNSEMAAFFESLKLPDIVEKAQTQFNQRQLNDHEVVQIKDTLNFAVIKSGLEVKEIILPHQYLKVKIINLLYDVKESQIQEIINFIEKRAQQNNKNLKKIKSQSIKITQNWEKMTSSCIISFKSTKKADIFYQTLCTIGNKHLSKQFSYLQNQSKHPKDLEFFFIKECDSLKDERHSISKYAISAKWSVTPSLRMGQIIFSNDIDAMATLEQFKKQKKFKAKLTERTDQQTGALLYSVQVEKLRSDFDEVDLEALVVNNYQGLVSVEIKRENSNKFPYCINPSFKEEEEVNKFLNFAKQNLPEIFQQKANLKKDTTSQENDEKMNTFARIHQGVCSLIMELDSQIQAQLIINKLSGKLFGEQKLRVKLQNKVTIPVLGYVYLLCYESIQTCLKKSSQLIRWKAPLTEDVFYPSRLVYIKFEQVMLGSFLPLNQLQLQLNNILKYHSLYLQCDPDQLSKVLQEKSDQIQNLEKLFDCLAKQINKEKPEIRIWFSSQISNQQIEKCKEFIKELVFKDLIISSTKFFEPQEKQDYLQLCIQAKVFKQIEDYKFEDNSVTFFGTKDKLKEIILNKQKQDTTCLICLQDSNLIVLYCSCIFCKDCIYSYAKISSVDEQAKTVLKPLTCPNHKKQIISIQTLFSIFERELVEELIQLRANRAIDDILVYSSNSKGQQAQEILGKAYIRCPSVNCNEFFLRYYPSSKQQEMLSTKQSLEYPHYQKCNGCFQEFCLLNSGKQANNELLIHSVHPNLSCNQHLNQQSLENQNIKSIQHLMACPVCDFRATKGEGCDHISCRCGAHFCYQCSKVFKEAKEVYDHLIKEHQSIYS